jgi:hypothetical protein
MISRGREIAYEAANSPTIPNSMPNYTHDQIRELYGELDKKTRRLQENEYLLHKPMIDAWNSKSPWSISSSLDECPLPKFRVEKNDQTILMAAYLSTGLSNKPGTINNTNDKEIIRGSFRTSIDDRTDMTPSPFLLNVRVNFDKLLTTSIEKQSQTSNIIPSLTNNSDSLIDLDQETTIPYETTKESPMKTDSLVTNNISDGDTFTSSIQINKQNFFSDDYSQQTEAFDLINNEDQSIEISTDNQKEEVIMDNSDTPDELSVKQSTEFDFLFNEENEYHHIPNDTDDDFQELYQRYIANIDQYETILQQIDAFEQKQDFLTPISEESVTLVEHDPNNKSNHIDEYCLTLTVKRQSNHIGHYGFELEQTFDGKIKISSINNSNYCPNLNIGDEIININNHSKLTTLEQCHLLFHSLWYQQYDDIQITVRKPLTIRKISSKYIKKLFFFRFNNIFYSFLGSEPVSLQSSSLSWPLSIIESGKIIVVFFSSHTNSIDLWTLK